MSGTALTLLILGSLAMPVVLIFALSRLSGWHTLSQRYPCYGSVPAPKKHMGYGVFRGWLGYNGGIVLASNEQGLYLSGMPVVLSFCHAPIFIPWSEVSEIRAKHGAFSSKTFAILTRRAPEVDFALRPGTIDVVCDDARKAGVAGDYGPATG
jgi:hypothetical protein